MPLPAYSVLTSSGANPSAYWLFLHGILGRGSNWRSIARRLVNERPELGAVLIDLRAHGDSRGFPPPHTLRAAAGDLEALADALPGPIRGILGHSFGGKVALTYAERHAETLDEVWIIDSPPSARPEPAGPDSPGEVLAKLESIDFPVPTRDAFVQELRARDAGETLARWLALNLAAGESGLSLTLELSPVRALLDDHYRTDLWPMIEGWGAKGHLHLVIGGKSTIFDREERLRAESVAERHPNVSCHTIPNAGHWVHAEAPDALLALLVGSSRSSGAGRTDTSV